MNVEDRRKKILDILKESDRPVSAGAMAQKFKVSRQIVVGDVALLRAEGHEISATPKGYVIDSNRSKFGFVGLIACHHDLSGLQKELYTVVDYGATVIDVMVEHPIYGEISGSLTISNRYDADKFVDSIVKDRAHLLSDLTGGIHLHRIGCRDREQFEMIVTTLEREGIALKDK